MSFESLSVLGQTYCCPMLFGVAIPHDKLRDTDYRKIVPYVFDSITCENDMKPDFIRTDIGATTTNYDTEASYDYTKSDEIVEFAKDRNMKVVGHVLWYEPDNLPQFVTDLRNSGSLNATVMSNIVNNHITNVITHFHTLARDTVYTWQVLNEALDASGNIQTDQIIQQILGDASFSNLFQCAQTVLLPTGINRKDTIKLFYNDSTNLSDDGIFNRLKTLKNSSGILDGVGIQCHGTASNTLDAMTLKYVQEGFEVHYTQVDNASDISDSALTAWYRSVIQIALKYGVTNFTVWGLIDSSSWLYDRDSQRRAYPGSANRNPLLFNNTFQPKSSYRALIEEIKIFGQQTYDIIVIIGQSNSTGNGTTEYNTFECPPLVSGVYTTYLMNKTDAHYRDDFDNKFNDNIRTFTSDNRIVPAFEGLSNAKTAGLRGMYGFGVSFARQYILEGKLTAGRKILLINRGYGDAGFLNNHSKRWNHYLENNLFDNALNSIKRAKSAINPNSEVKAILWHQGEADVSAIFDTSIRNTLTTNFDTIRIQLGLTQSTLGTYTEDNVKDLYSRSLITMLNLLRSEITSTTTPILLGGLCPSMYINHKISATQSSSQPANTNYPLMNQLILSISRNNGYRFVSAEPISTVSDFNHYLKSNSGSDVVHFSKSSQIELGKRYFFVYNDSITLNVTTFNNDIYDVFIILGQSNSVGRGKTEFTFDVGELPFNSGTYDMKTQKNTAGQVIYDDDFTNTENIKIKSFNERTSAHPQIINGREHVEGLDSGTSTDYGFGMSFARQYIKEYPSRKVLLINCGWGGTSIEQWAIDSSTIISDAGVLDVLNHTYEGRNLYNASLARIRSALSQINSSSTVKAILWHQGESNVSSTLTPTVPSNFDPNIRSTYPTGNNIDGYETQLTTILNSLRTNIASPDTLILLGGLCPSKYISHNVASGESSFKTGYDTDVRTKSMSQVILYIATRNGYQFVSAEPISTISHFNHYLKGNRGNDNIHFNKSSQIEFGRRYFYVYNSNRIEF